MVANAGRRELVLTALSARPRRMRCLDDPGSGCLIGTKRIIYIQYNVQYSCGHCCRILHYNAESIIRPSGVRRDLVKNYCAGIFILGLIGFGVAGVVVKSLVIVFMKFKRR